MDKKVRDQALPLAGRLLVQSVAAYLWNDRCEEAIDFGGTADMHFPHVLCNPPLERIVLCVPPITWQRGRGEAYTASVMSG